VTGLSPKSWNSANGDGSVPGEILKRFNAEISGINESCMFVTLFRLSNSHNQNSRQMKELEITLEHLESMVVLRAVGPVDSNTAAQLQEPLLRAAEGPTGAVELDLAEVSYMSSAGLRVLVLAAKALQKRGERLRLVKVPLQTYNVLNLAGFTSFIDIKT
jgi:anti-anti-sigma factor